MTSIGLRKGIQKIVFRSPNKSRITRQDSREDTGQSSAKKMEKNGTERTLVSLKENEIPSLLKWWDISKKLDTQYSRGFSAFNHGILRRKGGKCTVHFKAGSSNTELLFRTTPPANQISINGAVSRWCEELAQRILGQNELIVGKSVAKENEQLLKKVNPQEVNSVVQTSRTTDGAS